MESIGTANERSAQRGRGVGQGCRSAKTRAQWQKGMEESRLLEYLPLVQSVARRIHARLPQHVEIEDLISAGVLGLMDALDKFDPSKKVQFGSYAYYRIRGAILDSLRALDWGPRSLRQTGRAVDDTTRILTTQLGRSPSDEEVSGELGVELGRYHQLLGDIKGLAIGSLHEARNADSDEEELYSVPGRPEENPQFIYLHRELEDRMANAVARLPERERLVMTLYYYEDIKMREIALVLGVHETRVSQMHSSAVMQLREGLGDLAGAGRSLPGRSRVLRA